MNVGQIWKELPAPWRRLSLRPSLLLLAVVLFILEIMERRIGLRMIPIRLTKTAPARPNKRKTRTASPADQPPKPTDNKPTESALQTARTRARQRFRH